MITMGENKTFNLDDNRLYKIVDTKIIDKISYIPSARINTVILQWHEHGLCYIAYITIRTQNPLMQV